MHKATIHTHVVVKFRTNFTTENQGVDLYADLHLVNNFSRAAYASRRLIVRSNGWLADCISQPLDLGNQCVPWLTCLTLFACTIAHRTPQSTHLLATTASRVTAAASPAHCHTMPLPCIPYERHPQQPGDGGPAAVLTYMQVSNFGCLRGSTHMRIDLYASI